MYPGLAVARNGNDQQVQTQTQASPFGTAQSSTTTFGQNLGGKSPPSSAPTTGGISQSNTSAFGTSMNTGTAFGKPSTLQQSSSPWASAGAGNAPSFGQPAFGSSPGLGGSSQGSTFGMATGLGGRQSPWGAPSGTTAAAGNTFGQPSKLGFQNVSPASNAGATSSSTSGGFASFANSKGFAAAGANASSQSVFGGSSTPTSFSGNSTGAGIFGQSSGGNESSNAFGASSFQLGSTFKSDGSAINDNYKRTNDTSSSLFGSNFGNTLVDAAGGSKTDDMDQGEDNAVQDQNEEGKTTVGDPVLPNDQTARSNGLFGTTSSMPANNTNTLSKQAAGFTFGSTSHSDQNHKKNSTSITKTDSTAETSPAVKEEPHSEDEHKSSQKESEVALPRQQDAAATNGEDLKRETFTPETSPSPDSPLPPESTSKTVYAPGDSSSSSKTSDDAPLPPDFVPTKSKLQDVVQAPPPPPESSDDEDIAHQEAEVEDDEIESQQDRASGALDDEGSGVDVAQEISPASSKDSSRNTDNSFTFNVSGNKDSPQNLSSAPNQEKGNRLPLFGEFGRPSIPLYPSSKPQESPRSPSPIRHGPSLDILRPENARSVSAPGPAQSFDQLSSYSPVNTMFPRPQHHTAQEVRHREKERLLAQQNEQFKEEHQSLSDHEDEQNRRFLAADVKPSKVLDRFIAHQDYIGHIEKPGIPGQIEKVFRDINSMIDTLGINSRSLLAFVKGHETRSKTQRREQVDLDDLDWCLVESEDLNIIEENMLSNLEERKVQSIPLRLSEIREMHNSLSQIRRRSQDLNRTIGMSKDNASPDSVAQRPLNLDQQMQLKDLRKAFKNFQKQLTDAEQSIVTLRTDLASQSNGRIVNGRQASKQPTVEAVERTIRKLTDMIAEKNDDLDNLSLQLNELRPFSPSAGSRGGSPRYGSKNGSPSRSDTLLGGSAHGQSRSPVERRSHRSQLLASAHKESPLRRTTSLANGESLDVTAFLSSEEREAIKYKSRKRQEVNGIVKEVFGSAGVKVRSLD